MKSRRPLFSSLVLVCLGSLAVFGNASADAAEPTTEGGAFQPWVKRGLLIAPGIAGPRSAYLVSAPSVVKLKNGRLRMYFWASNDSPSRGLRYIFAVEASPDNPLHWELASTEPMLGPGAAGNDIRARGVGFPNVLRRDDGPWLMYYAAWGNWAPAGELSTRTGLAISRDEGLTWEVAKEAVLPLGKAGSYDAGLTGGMNVMRTRKDEYLMWYTAGERYLRFPGTTRSIVHTGLARSSNGIDWRKHERPVISPRRDAVDPFEAVTARPSVLRIGTTFHMWLGVFRLWPGAVAGTDGARHEPVGYRIEYARSEDGVTWNRQAGRPVLALTPGAFDSKHETYPSVVDMGDQVWMFYTGNDVGATGIGFATLDKRFLR